MQTSSRRSWSGRLALAVALVVVGLLIALPLVAAMFAAPPEDIVSG